MDLETQRKWDRAAPKFDLMNSHGAEWRWGPHKRELFSHMRGKVLFLAVGTGLDIPFFPPDRDIVGIDISPRMLEVAEEKAARYPGRIELRQMDVHDTPFEVGSFDQVYTSCTFCSVPDPVKGLRALRRVLSPDGELRMFEHTGSRIFPFNLMLHFMTLCSRAVGPDLNRTTVHNVRQAGFQVREVNHIFLDVVKTITAVPGEQTAPARGEH